MTVTCHLGQWIDTVCTAFKLDPLERGLQIADANTLAREHFPHLDPDIPAIIARVNNAIAAECKRVLMILYPPEHLITRLDAVGTSAQKIETVRLAELDQVASFEGEVIWFVPPLARPGSLNALGEVVAHLRAPDGCPWDRAQTHQSLRQDFLEECYEVLETLDQGDMPHLREELGDLLLHIFLQTQIATQAGEFLLTDVVADIVAKLIRRHPHVFGDVKVNGVEEIVGNWEKIKQAENGGKPKKASVPRALPALARAQKIAKRRKVRVRVKEIAASVTRLAHAKQRERVLGEVLFALAAYAAAKQIDAESVLRRVAEQAQV